MSTYPLQTRSRTAHAVFALLNPIPFGCFVAALIFDLAYASNADVLWTKAAGWLIALGLVVAIIPRLINLVHVWMPANRTPRVDKLDFWLNLFAIVAAIINAFVHSRDAYAVVPEAGWLSAVTVGLLTIGFIISALHQTAALGDRHHA